MVQVLIEGGTGRGRSELNQFLEGVEPCEQGPEGHGRDDGDGQDRPQSGERT